MKLKRTSDPRFPGKGRTVQTYPRVRRRAQRVVAAALRASEKIVFQPELRFYDYSLQITTPANMDWADTEVTTQQYIGPSGVNVTDGGVTPLHPWAQGSGYGEAKNNEIDIHRIHIRGSFHPENLATSLAAGIATNPVLHRLLLIMDTQPNGTQAQGEDIMQNLSPNVILGDTAKHSEGDRFIVLADLLGSDEVTNLEPGLGYWFTYSATTFEIDYTPKKPIYCRLNAEGIGPVGKTVNCNIFMLGHALRQTCLLEASGRTYYTDR